MNKFEKLHIIFFWYNKKFIIYYRLQFFISSIVLNKLKIIKWKIYKNANKEEYLSQKTKFYFIYKKITYS